MRVLGGGSFCLGVGRPGTGTLPTRPLVRSGVRPGPTTNWLWVRGVRAWGPVSYPTARALARCGGGMRVPGGGASCLGVGRPGTGALPALTSKSFGRVAGAHYPLAVGAGGAGVGTRILPHSTRCCVLLGRHEGARGGRLLPGRGASGDGRSPTPDHPSFRPLTPRQARWSQFLKEYNLMLWYVLGLQNPAADACSRLTSRQLMDIENATRTRAFVIPLVKNWASPEGEPVDEFLHVLEDWFSSQTYYNPSHKLKHGFAGLSTLAWAEKKMIGLSA